VVRALLVIAATVAGCLDVPPSQPGSSDAAAVSDARDLDATSGADAAADPTLLIPLKLDSIEEGTTPDSAAGFDGVCIDGCPVPVPGHIDGALGFDGSAALELVGSGILESPNGTVSLWVFLPDYPPNGGAMTLIGKAFDDPPASSFVLSVADTGVFTFAATEGSVALTTLQLPLAEWTHVAVTWGAVAASLELHLYAGGQTDSTMGFASFDSNPIRIGLERTNDDALVGMLDDVRIYARTLSAPEVAALAEQGESPAVN
jgi:hypothetical protein